MKRKRMSISHWGLSSQLDGRKVGVSDVKKFVVAKRKNSPDYEYIVTFEERTNSYNIWGRYKKPIYQPVINV